MCKKGVAIIIAFNRKLSSVVVHYHTGLMADPIWFHISSNHKFYV